MPRKYKKKAVVRRRKVYKKRIPKTTSISKVIGFPESMITKLVYYESIPTSAISLNQAFRGNSVFDPNSTGGGNQPNYFDTYASIYSTYRVVASKIEARIINTSSTVAVRANLMASDVNTFPTNVANAIGNPLTVSSVLTQSTGSKSMTRLSKYCTTQMVNGKSKAQIVSSDNYQAAINSNPTDVWYWLFQMEDIGLSNNMSATIDFKITYYVRFTDKFNQNLS